MSFPLDQALDEYAGGDCITCWPAGKTPRYLYACFSDIKQGDDWIAGVDPPPPNGVQRLEWSMFCDFGALVGNIGYAYRGNGDWSRLQVYDPGGDMFDSQIQPACTSYFENFIVNPVGNKYYGGFAIIASTLPGAVFSISDLCELINYERTDNRFANIHAIAGDEAVHVLYDWNSADRIRILFNHT